MCSLNSSWLTLQTLYQTRSAAPVGHSTHPAHTFRLILAFWKENGAFLKHEHEVFLKYVNFRVKESTWSRLFNKIIKMIRNKIMTVVEILSNRCVVINISTYYKAFIEINSDCESHREIPEHLVAITVFVTHITNIIFVNNLFIVTKVHL